MRIDSAPSSSGAADRPTVLIVHSENWYGPGRLPQLFTAAGATVHVLCPPGSYVGRSRYAAEVFTAPPSAAELCEVLHRHLAAHAGRYAAVIVTDERVLDALAARAGEAWTQPCLPWAPRTSNAAALRLAVSKNAFLRECIAADIPIPRSVCCGTADEAQDAASEIGYPVVVKRDAGMSGAGVAFAADAAQLALHYARFAPAGPVTVQRFVAGRVGASDVLYERGVPRCWSSFYKERIWPEPFGPAAVRRYVEPADIEPILRALGRITSFHGLAVMCWIEDAVDGKPRLLELNFRPGPGVHAHGAVGRMFAAALHSMLAGATYAGPCQPGCSGDTMTMFPQAVYRALDRHDVGALTGWIPGLPSARDLPLDDLPLLRAHLREITEPAIAAVKAWLAPASAELGSPRGR